MGQDGANHPLGQQFIQVYVQPRLLSGVQPHGSRLNRNGVVEPQLVVVLLVMDVPYVCLICCKILLTWYQAL